MGVLGLLRMRAISTVAVRECRWLNVAMRVNWRCELASSRLQQRIHAGLDSP
jgi:hypothetical protein